MINSWDKYYLKSALFLAENRSKDRSTKVGAIIIGDDNERLTDGYNGFPRKINDDIDSRHERPVKYFYAEHAERNAIYNAARNGIRLKDSTLYVTGTPCSDCARAIIQSGIKRVVSLTIDLDSRKDWGDSMRKSLEMFEEAERREKSNN